MDLEAWKDSLTRACSWLTDISLIRTKEHGLPTTGFTHIDRYEDWRGCFRGEYDAGTRSWDIFCPIWHGGQATKALALAYRVLKDEKLLESARLAADFLLRNQIRDADDKDFGHIRAFEGGSEGVNTSAILECLDGLFVLSEVCGDNRYRDAAVDALRWTMNTMFVSEEGHFWDDYDVDKGRFRRARFSGPHTPQPGRPLLDDGVFIKGYTLTGDTAFLNVAVKTAQRLVRDEDPPGNWKLYPPANPVSGTIHPRHAYWWGRPMWMLSQATGDQRYLNVCRRSADWYTKAMRTDGGLFRHTGPNFETPSFGHATSGICGAAVLWHDLIREYGESRWAPYLVKALRFTESVQFRDSADPNLEGAVLEKILPPRKSDRPPWYLRELGTVFYVQALSLCLLDIPDTIVEEA